MELMWGLKNLVKSLVPEEKLELTKEDHLLMSKGMTIFLQRKGFAVKPQMVNSRIVEMAYALYECDLCENRHAKSLQDAVDLIKEVSDINFNDWDSLKRVSAVKIICYPKETEDSKIMSYQNCYL